MAERPLRVYWGTAPTGAPHIGYFVPMLKIADFLQAGCDVTVLLADLHTSLDALKSMLEAIGVSTKQLRFVRGTDFQLSPDYTLDLYKLMAETSFRNANRAGAEVVKQGAAETDCLLSGLAYPLLQALDEVYLGVDVQFGGIDQRKIFILKKIDPNKKQDKLNYSNMQDIPDERPEGMSKNAWKKLQKLQKAKLKEMTKKTKSGATTMTEQPSATTPTEETPTIKHPASAAGQGGKLNSGGNKTSDKSYHRRVHLCNPMVPSLGGGKMSSSGKDKISILASPAQVKKLVGKAFCVDEVVEGIGLLAFCEFVLIPWRQGLVQPGEPVFDIPSDGDCPCPSIRFMS
ncbi:Tyrosine--tRNA ligase, cytoplasmic [Seminavis robusta]|uniref:tyrosine--tRNA ligase n=1 Tax=Seminavis robusta TaxID=568900 RepID=A0A9N8ETQ6_9STRA|nr:Tyrosine--tRNA ligase, cytoplasmic [Seminavis robusta]|eukprot:Sro1548_g281530.1 Tyrosine--tRNA ligase, cytoplasmic (344) ;mRNA; f:14-1045